MRLQGGTPTWGVRWGWSWVGLMSQGAKKSLHAAPPPENALESQWPNGPLRAIRPTTAEGAPASPLPTERG